MIPEHDPEFITIDLVQAIDLCKKGQIEESCENIDKFIAKMEQMVEELYKHIEWLKSRTDSPPTYEN